MLAAIILMGPFYTEQNLSQKEKQVVSSAGQQDCTEDGSSSRG